MMNKVLLSVLLLTQIQACRSTHVLSQRSQDGKTVRLLSSTKKESALSQADQSKTIERLIKKTTAELKKNPKNSSLLFNLASLYLYKKDVARARLACQKGLAHDLHNERGAMILAEIEFLAGNLQKAEVMLYRILAKHPKPQKDDDEIYNLLGLIALQRQLNDEAIMLFKKGLSINPRNSSIRMNLGTLHLQYKQIKEAQKQFYEVLNELPGHEDAMLHLAVIERHFGNPSTAKKHYQKVLKLNPDNYLALYNLSLIMQSENKLSEAHKLLKKALAVRSLPQARELVIKQEYQKVTKLLREQKAKSKSLAAQKARGAQQKEAH